MEAFSLDKIRTKAKAFVESPKFHRAERIAKETLIWTGVVTLGVAGSATIYDRISRARGGEGITPLLRDVSPLLPNTYHWVVIPDPTRASCFDATFIATHTVNQQENASIRVSSFVSNSSDVSLTQKTFVVDISGQPIVVETIPAFCFAQNDIPSAGIVFQAQKDGIQSEQEVFPIAGQ